MLFLGRVRSLTQSLTPCRLRNLVACHEALHDHSYVLASYPDSVPEDVPLVEPEPKEEPIVPSPLYFECGIMALLEDSADLEATKSLFCI